MKKPNQQAGFIQQHAEYGGTILGFILGLGVGLVVALAIAFYLSKNTPQEKPGIRAPNLPLTIKPAATPRPTTARNVNTSAALGGMGALGDNGMPF